MKGKEAISTCNATDEIMKIWGFMATNESIFNCLWHGRNNAVYQNPSYVGYAQ